MNQHYFNSWISLALLTFSLLLLSACTTTKKKGDLGALGKLYHNTTARYNGYFNARIIVEESIQKLNQQHKDNYNQLLPLYEYMALPDANPVASQLDEAIKKVSVVVNLHRPSKWTDDCYMIYGQANFIKQDYEAAEKGFSYLVDKYEPSEMEKRAQEDDQMSRKEKLKERRKEIKERQEARRDLAKKIKKLRKKGKYDKIKEEREEFEAEYGQDDQGEDESSEEEQAGEEAKKDEPTAPEVESGFLKHQPAFQKGQLWLARTYIERDRHNQAYHLMSELESEDVLLKEVSRELPVVQAYYYIDRDEFANAIPHLRTAITRSNDNERKARFSFILAQLYQKNGQQSKAFAAFEDASGYTNDYEMSFAARLNVLRNAFASGEQSGEETLRTLDKMLEDGKNKEYKDRIFYTKAEIALATEDKTLAKEHLHSSLRHSSGSQLQRAESYYRLAELYYEEGEFVDSKNYYDSTVQVMPESDPRFEEAQKLSENLDAIAENLKIISYQDSMLKLATMSEAEREQIARNILREQERRKQQKRSRPSQTLPTASPQHSVPQASSSNKPSSFFAYNQRALRKGVREFRNTWGDRPLEDNWRRSNRSDVGFASDTVDTLLEEETYVEEEVPEQKMNEIFKDVPQNAQEINLTEQKIIEAYYQLGILYRNKIEQYDYSAQAFETLIDRFPQNDQLLNALYYLYLDYLDLDRKDEAQQIKERVIEDFPDSKYARILTDPEYFKNREDSRKKVISYYDKTYELFERGSYELAQQRIQGVDSLFVVPSDLEPKFDLLKAMCYGHTSGKESYVRALEDVVKEHEGTKEEIRAKEILRFLKGDDTAFDEESVSLEEGQFLVEDDKLHYVIVILRNSEKVSLNDAKISLSEFNKSNFSMKNLRISNIVLDVNKGTPLIIIRRFEDSEEAMKYYENAKRHSKDFLPEEAVFDLYAINQRNYRQVLKERSAAAYELFFKKHYLNEKE